MSRCDEGCSDGLRDVQMNGEVSRWGERCPNGLRGVKMV